eukprot:6203866-Pleurochrysis_carterae.AAC.1
MQSPLGLLRPFHRSYLPTNHDFAAGTLCLFSCYSKASWRPCAALEQVSLYGVPTAVRSTPSVLPRLQGVAGSSRGSFGRDRGHCPV